MKAKLSPSELFLLVIIVLIGVAFAANSIEFAGVWIMRDIERALGILNRFDIQGFAGPELTHGGRLLGPTQNILFAIPLLFSKTLDSLYLFSLILYTLTLLFLYFSVRTITQSKAHSLIILSFVILNGFLLQIPQTLYNPSFLPFFLSLSLYMLIKIHFEAKQFLVPSVLLVWSLALQVHLSSLLFLPFIIYVFILNVKPTLRLVIISLISLLLPFLPFLVFKFAINAPQIEIDQYPYPVNLFTSLTIPWLLFWIFVLPVILKRDKSNGKTFYIVLLMHLILPPLLLLLPSNINTFFWGQPLEDILRRWGLFTDILLSEDLYKHWLWGFKNWSDPARHFYTVEGQRWYGLIFNHSIKLLYISTALYWLMLGSLSVMRKENFKQRLSSATFLIPLYFIPSFMGFVVSHLTEESEGVSPIHYKFYLLIPYLLFFGLTGSYIWKDLKSLKVLKDPKSILCFRFLLGSLFFLFLLSAAIVQTERIRHSYKKDPNNYKVHLRKTVRVRYPLENQMIKFIKEIDLSSQDFTSRLFYFSGLQEGANDVHYDLLKEGHFRNYSSISPQTPSLYQEDTPCLYVEAKKNWLDSSNLTIRARLNNNAAILRKKETASFHLWEYRPLTSDFCFTNTRVGYIPTATQRRGNRHFDIKWSRDLPAFLTGTEERSLYFTLNSGALNIPLIFEMYFDNENNLFIKVDSHFMSSYEMVTKSGYDVNLRRKQLRFQNLIFSFTDNDLKEHSVRLVRNPDSGNMLFGETYWENIFWLTYFPVKFHGPRGLRGIDEIKDLTIKLKYGLNYAHLEDGEKKDKVSQEFFQLKNLGNYWDNINSQRKSIIIDRDDFVHLYKGD